MKSYADISSDGRYRYTLGRRWGSLAPLVFIMLNPSTADAEVNDPTIRRCMAFSHQFGYGGIHVVNLYAYRATNPSELWSVINPVGPRNDAAITGAARAAASYGHPVIAAWGATARPVRVQQVMSMLKHNEVCALGVTKGGQPRHPLYLRSDSEVVPYAC